MSQNAAILTLTEVAAATITEGQAVAVGGTVAAAGGNALGIAGADASAGESVPVVVLGTAQATAGAAVSKGAALEVNGSGQLITATTGTVVGRALEAASAAGDTIEVLLIAN